MLGLGAVRLFISQSSNEQFRREPVGVSKVHRYSQEDKEAALEEREGS